MFLLCVALGENFVKNESLSRKHRILGKKFYGSTKVGGKPYVKCANFI